MSNLGNKKIFSENLKRYMNLYQKTRADICKDLNFAYTTFVSWETGVNYPRIDKIEKIANYFGIEKSDLIEEKNTLHKTHSSFSFDETTLPGYIPISKRKIPLLGTVAAGEPIFADENIEEYLPIDDTIHADFALHVKGNSMIGANIYDGDIVLVRKQNDVDDGQIGIVLKDDEATMKRVYHGKDHLTLIAENPDYPPIICSAETCSFCKILGLVTHVIHKFV